jgi:hypothetical protein
MPITGTARAAWPFAVEDVLPQARLTVSCPQCIFGAIYLEGAQPCRRWPRLKGGHLRELLDTFQGRQLPTPSPSESFLFGGDAQRLLCPANRPPCDARSVGIAFDFSLADGPF